MKSMQLRIYFYVVCKVFVWLLYCTWIRWVLWWCFQGVIWWRQGQGIRKGKVLVPSSFPLRLCSLLIFRKLLILIRKRVHFILFILLLCFFLCFTNAFVLYVRYFLTLNILISFLSSLHCIIMTQNTFQSLLRLIQHAKISRSQWMLLLVRVRLKY